MCLLHGTYCEAFYLSVLIAFSVIEFMIKFMIKSWMVGLVHMKGLIVLTFIGCHNNSTIIFVLPNGTSSLSMVCTVQEIRSHEVTNAYVPKPQHVKFRRLAVSNLLWMSLYFTKHSLPQGLATPNVMRMSPCLNMFL